MRRFYRNVLPTAVGVLLVAAALGILALLRGSPVPAGPASGGPGPLDSALLVPGTPDWKDPVNWPTPDVPLADLLPTPARTPDYNYDYVTLAISVVNESYPSVSGAPVVLLHFTTTLGQLAPLLDGNGGPGPSQFDQPVVVVLLGGNFSVPNPRIGFRRARFILYAFDPYCRCITFEQVSPKEKNVKALLDLLPAGEAVPTAAP